MFDFLVSGEAPRAQIGAMLMALRLRGETIDEIVGATDAMRPRMEPVVHALRVLGSDQLIVVHGLDGINEVTTIGLTFCAILKDGQVQTCTITPELIGLPRITRHALRGGDAIVNAAALRSVLEGRLGAHRDICLFNAAAALYGYGAVKTLDAAAASIDEGRALAALYRLVRVSNKLAKADYGPVTLEKKGNTHEHS